MKPAQDKLQQTLSEYFGRPLQLSIEVEAVVAPVVGVGDLVAPVEVEQDRDVAPRELLGDAARLATARDGDATRWCNAAGADPGSDGPVGRRRPRPSRMAPWCNWRPTIWSPRR